MDEQPLNLGLDEAMDQALVFGVDDDGEFFGETAEGRRIVVTADPDPAADIDDDIAPVMVDGVHLHQEGEVTVIATVDVIREMADTEALAIARRLAACVNACAGIPTDLLEGVEGRAAIAGAARALGVLKRPDRQVEAGIAPAAGDRA